MTIALLPLVLLGSWLVFRTGQAVAAREACIVTLGTMLALSLLGHKEPRFISPSLPVMHCMAAHFLISLFNLPLFKSAGYGWLPSVRRYFVQLILIINIPVALCFILVIQRGPITVTHYVRGIPAAEIRSLGFLLPCHTTPWQSFMHRPELEVTDTPSGYGGRMWALTCEPPLQ